MSKKEEMKQQFEAAFDDVEQKEEAAKALAVQTDQAISAWGDRETVIATGIRIKTMLPGGDKLTIPQALAAGQYAVATGLNPFRGEFYTMVDKKGNLSIIDGYKALTRWAEDECPYDDQYRRLEPEEGELFRIKCIIMRHDRKTQLDYYLEKGAEFQQAFDLVTTSKVGVVYVNETRWPNGDPKNAPHGWTWEQVAEKRALKNALNFSHAMPTVAELARKSWEVAGVTTKPEDWEGTEDLKTQGERERLAEVRARGRKNQEAWDAMSSEEQQAKAAANRAVLYGDYDEDDPFGEGVVNGVVVEETLEIRLASALDIPLHAPAPKLGLEKGQSLSEAVNMGESAKALIDFLAKPGSYEELNEEVKALQGAAALISEHWDTAVTMAGEGGATDSQAEETTVEEGGDNGGQTPLF